MPSKFRTFLHGLMGVACVVGAAGALSMGLLALPIMLCVVGIINLAVMVYDIKEMKR